MKHLSSKPGQSGTIQSVGCEQAQGVSELSEEHVYLEAPNPCICSAVLSEPPLEAGQSLILHTGPSTDLCQAGARHWGGMSSSSDAGCNTDWYKEKKKDLDLANN